jgi:hypothetical protein
MNTKGHEPAATDFLALLPELERARATARLRNPGFEAFAKANAAKIASKIKRRPAAEDRADILAELEVAARLAANLRLAIEYEPLGDKGPDFKVSAFGADAAFVEVKRLRLSAESTVVVRFRSKLVDTLHAAVPTVNFTIDLVDDRHGLDSEGPHPGPGENASKAFVEALAANEEATLATIVNAAQAAVTRGLVDGEKTCVPVAFGKVEVALFDGKGRDPARSSCWLTGIECIPYKQLDYQKVRSDILSKLQQCQAGAVNVLILVSVSDTLDESDFEFAVKELVCRAYARDDGYFRSLDFADTNGFVVDFQKLSVLAYDPKWLRNATEWWRFTAWDNPLASAPLAADSEIRRHLQAM